MSDRIASLEAEQALLGAILLDNGAIDRIPDLEPAHFYEMSHRTIFMEMCKQISMGNTCDVVSLLDAYNDVPYLNALYASATSSAAIRRHADTVIDRAMKRALLQMGHEIIEMAKTAESARSLVERFSSRVDGIAQTKVQSQPVRLSDALQAYIELLSDRMDGKIKPIATGYVDLDNILDGGLERGTLTIVAARPGMGKTAFALGLCRNVAAWGASGLISMEMTKAQVNDRNIAAIGRIPLGWLKKPDGDDTEGWNRVTHAFTKANTLNFYIDDQTSLNMLEIRAKARAIKRQGGLDLLAIDQLSFITGGTKEKEYEQVGEYTRGLIALGKEMNCAVVLLCQLNRKCEDRQNKRPLLSDLAMSGSIEQDAANIIFLYRDEIYNPDSRDKGICEAIIAKQRQGSSGTIPLAYIGDQTRFEDYAKPWQVQAIREMPRTRGYE